MSSRPLRYDQYDQYDQYDPSQYPPYVPPEAVRTPAPKAPEGDPSGLLSPQQAQASFAELVDPFAPVVSAQAIFSVIFAIVGATLLPVFAQVVSILLGARALRRIKRSDGAIIGRRLAWFGILFSALCLFGYLALFALFALFVYGVLSLGFLGAS